MSASWDRSLQVLASQVISDSASVYADTVAPTGVLFSQRRIVVGDQGGWVIVRHWHFFLAIVATAVSLSSCAMIHVNIAYHSSS
jgi:hypothetical protein